MSGSLKDRPCNGCLTVNLTSKVPVGIAFTISNQIAVCQFQIN